MRQDTGGVSFTVFLWWWNILENRELPPVHYKKMANWLEQNWIQGNTRLLLLAFRASGKSTLVGLFAAWLLYINPDTRILVLAADFTLAVKMVQQVRRIIETHPLTSEMKPDKPEQWAANRFTIKRRLTLRDPSMLARGIASNITGSRADVIICDDVEVPVTCETAEKREALRGRLGETAYVLVPGGLQLYIGTSHTWNSIYAETPRLETGEEKTFLDGYERLSIPVIKPGGKSAWPEKFSETEIEKIRLQSGPHKFASQMLLIPVNIADARLDPDLLNLYEEELEYSKELQTLFLGNKKLVSASGWWDPSFGSAKGDNSVLAAVFTDEGGDYYLHCVEYLKSPSPDPRLMLGSPSPLREREARAKPERGEGLDAATTQCRAIAQLAKKLRLPSLTVESNGLGKFLPGILKNEMVKAKTPCAVQEHMNTKPKDIRILEAFDALLAARRLHVHKSVLDTPFMTEMREWQPGKTKNRDDGLDAAAGALAQQPVRIKRLYGSGKYHWPRGKKSHKAQTEFEI